MVYFSGNYAVFGVWPAIWRTGWSTVSHLAKPGEYRAFRLGESAVLRYNEYTYSLAALPMPSVPSRERESMTRMIALASGDGRTGRSRGIRHAVDSTSPITWNFWPALSASNDGRHHLRDRGFETTYGRSGRANLEWLLHGPF